MELDDEVSTTKTSMIEDSTIIDKPPSLEQQPKITQTRKFLLILIGILLVLCFINFIFIIHSYLSNNSQGDQTPISSSQLVSVLISFVYYGFGLLVTYRYYQTGLLIYAWLGFVSFLLMLTVALVILFENIIGTSYIGFARGLIIAIIFIILCLTTSLIQIFTIRFAFRLSKLLQNTKRLTIEQI